MMERTTELSCNVCYKIFSNKTNLKLHQLQHDDENNAHYQCGHENCSRIYEYKKNLIQHIRSIHQTPKETARIPCSYKGCTKDFKLKLYLRRHLAKQHTKNKKRERTVRRKRFDKGKPTKSMAAILSGLDLPIREQKKIIVEKKADNPSSICTSTLLLKDITYKKSNKRKRDYPFRLGRNSSRGKIDENKFDELLTRTAQNIPNNEASIPSDSTGLEKPANVDEDIDCRSAEVKVEITEEMTPNDEALLNYCDATLNSLEKQIKKNEQNTEEALDESAGTVS